jgi:DNA-binding response OmpR family regulator
LLRQQDEGFVVITAASEEAALRHLEEAAVDLLVLDIMLAEVDGLNL